MKVLIDPSLTRDNVKDVIAEIHANVRAGNEVYVVSNGFARWLMNDPALEGLANLHFVTEHR